MSDVVVIESRRRLAVLGLWDGFEVACVLVLAVMFGSYGLSPSDGTFLLVMAVAAAVGIAWSIFSAWRYTRSRLDARGGQVVVSNPWRTYFVERHLVVGIEERTPYFIPTLGLLVENDSRELQRIRVIASRDETAATTASSLAPMVSAGREDIFWKLALGVGLLVFLARWSTSMIVALLALISGLALAYSIRRVSNRRLRRRVGITFPSPRS